MKTKLLLSLTVLGITSAALATPDPWADAVVNYTPGSNPGAGFTLQASALGEPTRISGGFAVSPYSSPFGTNELVSIGEGGSLTVSFDEPIKNDPNNPFGIDLLIFGNAFLTTNDVNFDAATTNTGASFAEPGIIEISANGVDFTEVTGVFADELYPTNGFADATTHFPPVGSVLSDFTLPVDPSLNLAGLTALETYAGYNGSGGGAGVDIGNFGFSQISYVRISNPIGSGVTPEIDAFADVSAVPEPSSLLLLLAALPLSARRN